MISKAPNLAPDRKDAAAYIADMSGNLARMARDHDFSTLSYLLEMAKLEAELCRGRNAAAQ